MNPGLSSVLPWLDALAWPWALLALPLPWLMRWWPRRNAAAPALRVPYAAGALAELGQAGGVAGWRIGRLLLWLAWACLCVAMARPQQLGEPVTPPQQGRQMMLAVDVSGSMSEPDMMLGNQVVQRLSAAKAVLADFLDRRAGDRVGLLIFGERAYTLTPITADLTTVRNQLTDSEVGLAGRDTAIGDAIALAVKRLREQPEGQRVLILLTDGVNTAGAIEPRKAAELASADHVRVHTIAFGGDGTLSVFGIKLPIPGGGDDIDETTLRAVAKQTGGRFFRARDTSELAGIYAEIDRLEPIQRPGEAVRPRIERYVWPLAAAFVLALLAFAMQGRRRA